MPDAAAGPSDQPTLIRHGQGYTIFERNTHGLCHTLTLLVPPADPIKLVQLRAEERLRPTAPAVGDVLRRMGARPDPRPYGDARRHRD